MVNTESPKPPSVWRFWIPLLFQVGLILSVPIPAIYTHLTGRVVMLETEPVDPKKFFRGSSQTVTYQISNFKILETIPGWKELPGTVIPCPKPKPGRSNTCKESKFLDWGINVYVILEKPEQEPSQESPTAWKPVELRGDRPRDLPAEQVVIPAKSMGDSLSYGLENFSLSTAQIEEINIILAQNEPENKSDSKTEKQRESFVVELKVDEKGNAVPVSLWVGDRQYRL